MSDFETDEFDIDSPEAELGQYHLLDEGLDRSVSSKEDARRQLEEDMRRFLTGGGQIRSVEANMRADPPRKPESNYGSRPI